MTPPHPPPLADGRRHADTAQWTPTLNGGTLTKIGSQRLGFGNAYRASYNSGAGCKRRVWTRNDPIHPPPPFLLGADTPTRPIGPTADPYLQCRAARSQKGDGRTLTARPTTVAPGANAG